MIKIRKNFLVGICLFSFADSSFAAFSEKIGGYLSGSVGVGQFGSSSAGLDDRFMVLGGVDGLLGFNYREVTWGLQASYDVAGQLTPISNTGGTNSKGSMYLLGLGARYFISEDMYLAALFDLTGQYTFLEKTLEGETDQLSQPFSLRLKIGKRLPFSELVTLDGDIRYHQFKNFHIGGRDYDWNSQLWSVGVALTWHFGKAAPYVPEVESAPVEEASTTKVSANETQQALADSKNTEEAGPKAVRIRSKYVFSANHYRVDRKMVAELKEIAAKINNEPEASVEVLGYSDNSGDANFNRALSKYRAQSVRDYLIKLKVDPRRMKAIGMADQDPTSSNDTKEGRAVNRRFEIVLKFEGAQ